MSYRQTKTDFCQFCGDILGLGPKLIVERVIRYFPFECSTKELIACTECRRELGHRQVIGVERCSEFLVKAYDPEFQKLKSALDWTDEELEDKGYNVVTSIEVNRRRARIVAAKLENLARVSNGVKAITIRELRANFERAKIVSSTK